MKKQIKVKDILYLQLIVMIFSLSSVTAQFASGQKFMTRGFILFYGLEVVILAVYALLWQQAIKKFDISIAYANKAMVLLWGLLWSVVIFHDSITVRKVFGVALVICGVIILNRGQEAGQSGGKDAAGAGEKEPAPADAGGAPEEKKEADVR